MIQTEAVEAQMCEKSDLKPQLPCEVNSFTLNRRE